MKSANIPETAAILFLRLHNVEFYGHLYPYVNKGGTSASSLALGVEENLVIKTLLMEDEGSKPLIVLMHGDKKVSLKELARQIGCKKIESCKPDVANRHSGYLVGGTSPFATKKKMPVYMEESILDLQKIYINGGRRGFLIEIDPADVVRILGAKLVNVAIDR